MHLPVLKKEVLEYLDPKPNENFIDCTANGGGHTRAITKRGANVLAIELDKAISKELNSLKLDRVTVVNDSYINLEKIVEENNFRPVNGILFDLGMSDLQLEESGRGFTFQKNEPLDMRYSLDNNLTAEEIINKYSYQELEKIFREYGEERFSRRIAKKIIDNRPIKTTFELVKVIKQAKVHSFRRIFQALRIAVNKELSSLEEALPKALEILAPGGRLVVISFHSLEDRIVKNFFKNSDINILTKKPITGDKSAKLRSGIKL